jgi:hypothetical protein
MIESLEAAKARIEESSHQAAIDTIVHEARVCEAYARENGFEDIGPGYELTAQDCEFIADSVRYSINRFPTKEEWAEAGFSFVGNAHYLGR